MAVIGKSGSLEESLRRVAGEHKDELEGRGLPNGSPSALIICVAAMGCLSMIKKMPELNQVKSDSGLASVSASTPCASSLCAPLCDDNYHVKFLMTTWTALNVLPLLNSADCSL